MSLPISRSISLEGEDISLELALESEQDGKRIYRMQRAIHGQRGALLGLPMALLLGAFAFSATVSAPEELSTESGEPSEARAKGEVIVEGTASSTSKDWYGTEMNREALEDMRNQFSAGVSVTPRHNGWWTPIEWDEVIGLTTEGTVRATEVSNPSEPSEQGYILDVKAKLFTNEEKAQTLKRRLEAKQPIGLSIGGWFTDIRIITDEEDEIERIIVQKVMLDHLAVTRSPANPDSNNLRLLRSMGEKAIQAMRIQRSAPAPIPAPSPPSPEEGKSVEIVDKPASANDTPAQEERGNLPSNTEDTMTAEEIARIAAEAARAVIAESRNTPPAPTPTPAPAVDPAGWEARAKQAEADKAALQSQMRAMAGRTSTARQTMIPNHGYAPGTGEGSQLRSLVQLSREEGKVALAEVSERHEKVLGADLYDPQVTRAQLEVSLREIIHAGLQDGIIRDPSQEVAWK